MTHTDHDDRPSPPSHGERPPGAEPDMHGPDPVPPAGEQRGSDTKGRPQSDRHAAETLAGRLDNHPHPETHTGQTPNP